MNRRAFLGAVVSGVGAVGGCLQAPRARPASREAGRATPPPDVELPVPESDLFRSAPRDAIPAITGPAFADDWEGIEVELGDGIYRPRLAGDDRVVGVEDKGTARAYPLKMLRWHEVVNDTFGSVTDDESATADAAGPLLVTYCPLCASGVAAERSIRGTVATFGVSGHLWRGNLVMYDDATESLWSQLLATAIRGPATGETLDLLPSTLTTWRNWRADHPDGEVLLPAPESRTVLGGTRINYDLDIHERWEDIRKRYPEEGDFGGPDFADTRLRRREVVVGVRADGEARAYSVRQIRWKGVVNDSVGDLPVVVTLAGGDTPVAYVRQVGGRTLTFARDGEYLRAGGSRWDPETGRAVDGPYGGTTLDRATDRSPMYWFAWLSFNPDTTVYGVDG